MRQSQAAILAGILWDALHRAEPGREGRGPVGQEQMLGAWEGVCLGSRYTSSFPTGALAAPVPAAAALPLDRASCSPREAFPGTALGANKRSQEAQDRLSTCHSSPQILPSTI